MELERAPYFSIVNNLIVKLKISIVMNLIKIKTVNESSFNKTVDYSICEVKFNGKGFAEVDAKFVRILLLDDPTISLVNEEEFNKLPKDESESEKKDLRESDSIVVKEDVVNEKITALNLTIKEGVKKYDELATLSEQLADKNLLLKKENEELKEANYQLKEAVKEFQKTTEIKKEDKGKKEIKKSGFLKSKKK